MLGAGTVWNPFIIEDITDFQDIELDLDANYVLNSDIDASSTFGWVDGSNEGFTPINLFAGSLDGRGHKVDSLYIYNEGIGAVFQNVTILGRVQNIGFSNINVIGAFYSASLCLVNEGRITQCYVTGSVVGGAYGSGGFCASNQGEISNCYSKVRVNGVLFTGGFTGDNQSIIANCYSAQPIYYQLSNSGFTYGGNDYSNNIWTWASTGLDSSIPLSPWPILKNIDCALLFRVPADYYTLFYEHGKLATALAYINAPPVTDLWTVITSAESIFTSVAGVYSYTGDPSGWAVAGGFDDPPTLTLLPTVATLTALAAGFCCSNTGTVLNCYWDTDTSGCATSVGGTGKTTAEMCTEATFIKWDFLTPIWTIDEGNAYPLLEYVPPSATTAAGVNVSISFTTGAFDTPSWEDVSSDVMSISVKRGRQNEMNRVEAGTATVQLFNTSGDYWPDLTTGVHAGYVKPLKQIRINEEYNGIIYGVFMGVIESWVPSFLQQKGMKVPVMTVQCVDVMKSLARFALNLVYTFPTELSGIRIGRVLSELGWPADKRKIDLGQSYVQALNPITNINGLTHIQDVASAESGVFFIDGAGNACFHDRDHRAKEAGSAILITDNAELGVMLLGDSALGEDGATYSTLKTFGNPRAAGDMVYNGIDYLMEDQYVYNDIRVTIPGGVEQVAQDDTSIAAYGLRTLSKSSLLLTSDEEAEFWANYWLTLYKDPVSRCKSLTIFPAAEPANLYPLAFGYDISQKIRIRLVEAGLLGYFYIEGISHNWTAAQPQMWATQWQLSNANDIWWILEDETFGLYGVSTRMGY